MLASSVITFCSPIAAYSSFKLFVALRILLGFFQVRPKIQLKYLEKRESEKFLATKRYVFS